MSKMSKVMESILKHQKIKEGLDNERLTEEKLEKRSIEEDEKYKLPIIKYHSKVKIKEMFGCQIVVFNENTNNDNIIIYLHGGAYLNEIQLLHVTFCDKLAKKTNSTVFAPIYPLTPNHTYKETYKIVENLYDYVLKFNKSITIMGDSAGGGLSASFTEYLGVKGLTQPQHLILMSPWVDISMSGDYDEYDDLDPMLGVDGLREIGGKWAGDLNLKDYRLSPLFGDVTKLPQTTLFVGTHEIFYPDIIKFYNKLTEKGVDVELNVGEEMSHVYPLYPFVPEADEAFNHIVEILL